MKPRFFSPALVSCFLMFCAWASAAWAAELSQRTDDQGTRATVCVSDGPAAPAAPGLRGGDASAWDVLGPFGGDIEPVAVWPLDDNVVLAGLAKPFGFGKLYRSVDGGDTWSSVEQLDGLAVYDIEFTAGGTTYIGTMDGVWASPDGGITWAQHDLGIGANDETYEVAIDPNNDSVIWAGVAEAMGSQPQTLMRSTDGGINWVDVTPPMGTPLSGRGVAIDPANSDNVAACFGGGWGGGAVWVSTDGGSSWVNRSAGLPDRPMNDIVHDGARLLVGGGMAFGSQMVGVYASSDSGLTWAPLHDASWPDQIINKIEVNPSDSNVIYVASERAGIFQSTDGGTSWSFGLGDTGSITTKSIRLAPGSSVRLFVGASSLGVLRSLDGGTTFDQTSTGIAELNVMSVAANPLDAQELLIGFAAENSGGVYRSTDAGQTWTLAPVPPTRYTYVSFAPDGTPYALSDGPSTIAPEGLYRRNPNGSWVGIGPDQGTMYESYLFTFEFSLNDSNVIFAGGRDFGVVGSEPTIFRTTDAGATWTKVYEGSTQYDHVTDIAFVPDGTEATMLASYSSYGEVQNGGVLRSTDGGLLWSPSNTGLPYGVQGESLTPLPSSANAFLLADSDFGVGGVHKTVDAGLSWTSTDFVDRVERIVLDPFDEQILYISQPNWTTRVQVSMDGGATFTPFASGLDPSSFVRGLVLVPDSCPPRLLLATTKGTYESPIPVAPTGDGDGDGDVDLVDFARFLACFGSTTEPSCCQLDFDGNGNIDLSDFADLHGTFTGPGS